MNPVLGCSRAYFFLDPGFKVSFRFDMTVEFPPFASTAVFQREEIDFVNAEAHDTEVIEASVFLGSINTALDFVQLLAGLRSDWGARIGLPKLGFR